MGEPTSTAAGRSGRRVAVEQLAGGLEVAGHGARHDGRVPLGHEQAEVSAGAQHLGDGGEGAGRVLDHLHDAVAEHEVGRLDQARQVGHVALLAGDPVGDPALAGAAVEGGQGVRAGVDDLDGVAELGQRHGETSGAAADVDDAGLPAGGVVALQHPAYALPHHAGADGLATVAGRGLRHGSNPSGSQSLGSEVVVSGSPRRRERSESASWGGLIRGSRDCGATACGRRPELSRRPA